MTNKEKYRKFCESEKQISIFSKDWWLDTVCGEDNWDVAMVDKGGNTMATMPYFIRRRYKLNIISQPILTQTLGIYFKYPVKQKYYKKLSFEKEMTNEILKQLPKFARFNISFNYKTTNLLPFYWKGFDIGVKYTYTIEDISMEDLEKNFETNVRNRRRRKAEKYGVVVFESEDIRKFYELNQMTFTRQGRDIPYSFELIENLYKICKKNNACKMFFAKDENNEVIAGNFLVYDEHTVYYLMGGIDPDKKDLGGMDIVQHKSIAFALENNLTFDFEGSMVESIEKYFRSFGATQKPYFQISKTNSKLLKFKDSLRNILK